MLYNKITDTIGSTPMVKCENLKNEFGLKANIYAKLEFFNPGSSVKDRIALNMLREALNNGEIDNDTTIIEATSGNTGIGLALCCASLNLKCIIVMPDSASAERKRLIKAFGAKLEIVCGEDGMSGAIKKANELFESIENSYIPSQFENPNNPDIHKKTTGQEILDDLLAKIDVFIAGVGTGGTISGVARALKKEIRDVKIIAVEPKESSTLSNGSVGTHKIEGIGAGFVPLNFDPNVVDEILPVSYKDAKDTVRMLAKTEGILVGPSSGAVMNAAIEFAKQEEYKDKNIVVLLCDTGERYLSTDLFE
ncbi:MAG: cysteine synthase A [Anaerorhabdus sp.]